VDRWTAFVAIAHLKLRLEILQRHPEYLKDVEMTPTFKGLGSALSKLKYNLDLQAAPLMSDIETLSTEAPELLKQAAGEVAKTKQAVADIKDFVSGLIGDNGAPLDVSSTQSAASGTTPTVDATVAHPANVVVGRAT
jgi:hypothetical protein